MKTALFSVLFSLFALHINAQGKAPELEFALQLKVTIGKAYGIDNTQHGRRTVIPITGGTFEGPKLKGTIINGGADYQLNTENRTELEAIYCIRTDDGVNIHVRNKGIIYNGKDAEGNPTFYFRAAPPLRRLPTVSMLGSTTPYLSAPPNGRRTSRASSSMSGW